MLEQPEKRGCQTPQENSVLFDDDAFLHYHHLSCSPQYRGDWFPGSLLRIGGIDDEVFRFVQSSVIIMLELLPKIMLYYG